MVKLASARESRLYGPWLTRNRLEYINAGLYVFAVILLLLGFVAQIFKATTKPGLIILLIALVLIIAVNVHDLFAHLSGIDYQMPYMESDMQLGLVEFVVPMVQALGSLLPFLGILFLLIQEGKGNYGNFRLETNALNLIIAGWVMWVIGSILNSCQIYERADGPTQILQGSVYIPFLMGSLLFMGRSWVWLGLFGSLLLLIGGLMNLTKVYQMQHIDGVRLEKLRGGAQDRLNRRREGMGQTPLIIEQRRQRLIIEESRPVAVSTPYKDVLVGHSGNK